MCDCNTSCFKEPPTKNHRELSMLLLDCWQREYDKRPYRNFEFDRLDFEKRMQREYDPVTDFQTILMFLRRRILKTIKLKGFTVLCSELTFLCNFVESLKKFERIELKLMNLPTDFFELLNKNVEGMNVTELSLEGTPLNDNDILYLRSFVLKSSTLKILNVAVCNINQYNFANLADGIHKSDTVASINISRLMGKYLSMDSDKISHILSSLLWQNKLQEIILEKCELQAQDMELIAEYLYYTNLKLQKLNVAYNKIGADGAEYLLKAISHSKTLKYLNLSGCALGTLGGEVISKYLGSCYHLESLILQNNDMEPEAVNMILLCMEKPHKLNKLYFYGNRYNLRTGDILKILLDSKVVTENVFDVTDTYDDSITGYRVIPWFK